MYKDITIECNCTPKDLFGNSAPTHCATPGCSGIAYGNHVSNCIGNYCFKCIQNIKHERNKYNTRKRIISKYKNISCLRRRK